MNPYTDVAYRIGRQLASKAISSTDKRCNWLGVGTKNFDGQSTLVTKTFEADVYHGLSGIALFLGELQSKVNDPIIEEILEETLNNCIYQHQNTPLKSAFSFYHGQLGLGFVLWKLGLKFQNSTWRQEGLAIFQQLSTDTFSPQTTVSEVASAVPLLLQVYQIEQQPTLLQLAKECGEFILQQAIKEPTYCYWKLSEENPLSINRIQSVGRIAIALIHLYRFSEDIRFKEMAIQGLKFEENQISTPSSKAASIETISTFLNAYTLTHEPSFLNIARMGLDSIISNIQQQLQSSDTLSFSLHNGILGTAEVLLHAATLLPNPIYQQLSLQITNLGIALYHQTETDWRSGVLPPNFKTPDMIFTPSLMVGSAGVGYFYLRLAYPNEITSVLI